MLLLLQNNTCMCLNFQQVELVYRVMKHNCWCKKMTIRLIILLGKKKNKNYDSLKVLMSSRQQLRKKD